MKPRYKVCFILMGIMFSCVVVFTLLGIERSVNISSWKRDTIKTDCKVKNTYIERDEECKCEVSPYFSPLSKYCYNGYTNYSYANNLFHHSLVFCSNSKTLTVDYLKSINNGYVTCYYKKDDPEEVRIKFPDTETMYIMVMLFGTMFIMVSIVLCAMYLNR